FSTVVRARTFRAHGGWMAKDPQRPKEPMSCAPPAPPRGIGEALAALSEDDLLRLRAIARLRARSLPGAMSWSDLLHQAVLPAVAARRAAAGISCGREAQPRRRAMAPPPASGHLAHPAGRRPD